MQTLSHRQIFKQVIKSIFHVNAFGWWFYPYDDSHTYHTYTAYALMIFQHAKYPTRFYSSSVSVLTSLHRIVWLVRFLIFLNSSHNFAICIILFRKFSTEFLSSCFVEFGCEFHKQICKLNSANGKFFSFEMITWIHLHCS